MRSTVATKVLIALTGLALFLFLIAHLAGNLLVLVGPEAFNAYSHKLISNPLIYLAEAGLAAVFLVHIYKTVTNYFRNSAARPVRYHTKTTAGHTTRKSVSSSSMIVTGTIILIFLLLHLKTFKFGAYYDAVEPGVRDLYRLTLEVFHQPGYVIWYVVAMVLLGMHLRHGIASAMQSLGAAPNGLTHRLLKVALVIAVLIAGGFAFIPVWIYLFTQ